MAYSNRTHLNIIVDNFEIQKKLISIILRIFIDLLFVNLSDKEIYNNMLKLIRSIEFKYELLSEVCQEIEKIFCFLFNINNEDKKNKFKLYINKNKEINISKIFSHLFKFIFTIINSIINSNNFKEKYNIIRVKLTNEVLSLLIAITKKINEEFLIKNQNGELYFCLMNYIKFLYKIVFYNDLFYKFTLLEIDMFIFNLSDLVNLCYNKSLLNSNILIKIKSNNHYYKKTFIEIILDNYINILFNDKFEKSHKLIYKSLNSVFDNIGKNKVSIFYYNDQLIKNILNKGGLEKDQKIKENIKNINSFLMPEDKVKFEMSFTTFFLLKIAAYSEFLKNNILKNDDSLKNYFDKIIKKLILEHKDLYNLNADLFSKISNYDNYNNLKNIIERNIKDKKSKIKENNLFSELKEFFYKNLSILDYPISDQITSENCNIVENNKKRHKSQVLKKDYNDLSLNNNKSPNMQYSTNTNFIKGPIHNDNNRGSLDLNNPSLFYENNIFLGRGLVSNSTLSRTKISNSISIIDENINNGKEIDNGNNYDLQLNLIEDISLIKPKIEQNKKNDINNNININNNDIDNINLNNKKKPIL